MIGDNEIKCPSCGSDDVSKPRLSRAAFAISVLFLGFPLPFMGKKYHCFDCGLDFEKADEQNPDPEKNEEEISEQPTP
jgi:DNA-directed RNA polymerase subunit RPC12/RpoP